MTNKENIQTMKVEELAQFLVNITECNKNCLAADFCTVLNMPCEVFFLEWLNSDYIPIKK